MHKHYSLIHRPRLFSIVDKGLVIFQSEPHAANDYNVSIGLVGNAHEQSIVGFARNRKDGDLLRHDEAVKHIDHWNICTHHVSRNNPFYRIEGSSSDIYRLTNDLWTSINWLASTIHPSSKQFLSK